MDTVGSGDNFKARIDVLAGEETVAVVRDLEEKWGGRINFTVRFTLARTGEEWKIVSKIFTAE